MEWGNPTPVSVVLQPVGDGFLLGKRAIAPGFGKFSLPGGFVDRLETFRQAAARELMEEMGITVNPEALVFFGEHIVEETNILLTFWTAPKIRMLDMPMYAVPNEEVSEQMVAIEPIELAFSSHTLMLKRALELR